MEGATLGSRVLGRRQLPRGTIRWEPVRRARFLGSRGKFVLLVPARALLRDAGRRRSQKLGRQEGFVGKTGGNAIAIFSLESWKGASLTRPTAPKHKGGFSCAQGCRRVASRALSPGLESSVGSAGAPLPLVPAAREEPLGTESPFPCLLRSEPGTHHSRSGWGGSAAAPAAPATQGPAIPSTFSRPGLLCPDGFGSPNAYSGYST